MEELSAFAHSFGGGGATPTTTTTLEKSCGQRTQKTLHIFNGTKCNCPRSSDWARHTTSGEWRIPPEPASWSRRAFFIIALLHTIYKYIYGPFVPIVVDDVMDIIARAKMMCLLVHTADFSTHPARMAIYTIASCSQRMFNN